MLDFEDRQNGAILLNNADWLANYPLVPFLRDIGKHFPIGLMLGKDSVRSRLDAGISFTEFSYMLLQSCDFLHLHDHHGCRLQIGGQDQWGNITAGVELIRRVRGAGVSDGAGEPHGRARRGETFGLTFPLVTTASGAKFGKSEGGNIWLDPARTSPFELYQYFVNTDDRDVIRYLKWFTFLEPREIMEYERLVEREPEGREAQRRLAREFTVLVHGDGEARAAENASGVLFGCEIEGMTDDDLEKIFRDVPRYQSSRAVLDGGLPLVDVLVESGVSKSRTDARRLLTDGAVYLNNRRVEDPAYRMGPGDLASSSMAVLRKGKKNYLLIRFG
jgi:tyrosyl-tRNA synthetase